jgi:predicted nucleic acid-binding protein
MVLVDSNVLLDVFNVKTPWHSWSHAHIAQLGQNDILAINPIIYAEISYSFATSVALNKQLENLLIEKLDLPYEAGFLAGQAFLKYRRRGGEKRSPLPDFYIGAHARTAGFTLLTRDATRYRTYFPGLKLVAP